MSDREESSRTEYEFEPFDLVYLRRVEQIKRLVRLTDYALRSLEGAAELTQALRKPKEQVERTQDLENLALAEVAAGTPLLYGAATVLLWGALEASVRDFLVRWFEHHPDARKATELKNIRIKLIEYESFEGQDRMRYLVGILERELGASLRPGIARFECLLSPLGISPKVTDESRRTLNELAAIRNVIVHRAGLADSRLLELCPWLGLKLGEEVRVTHESFVRYLQATSYYAADIIRAARRLIAPVESQSVRELE